jgi:hypothetical protein
MKRLVLALTLACALSATALAGEIPSTGNPAPALGSTQGPSIAAKVILTIISLVR